MQMAKKVDASCMNQFIFQRPCSVCIVPFVCDCFDNKRVFGNNETESKLKVEFHRLMLKRQEEAVIIKKN